MAEVRDSDHVILPTFFVFLLCCLYLVRFGN